MLERCGSGASGGFFYEIPSPRASRPHKVTQSFRLVSQEYEDYLSKVKPKHDVLPEPTVPQDSDLPSADWEHVSKNDVIDVDSTAVIVDGTTPEAQGVSEPKYLITTASDKITLTVNLSGISSIAQVSLDVSHDRVKLQVPDQYSMSATLPFSVDPQNVTAKFKKRTSQLTVLLYAKANTK